MWETFAYARPSECVRAALPLCCLDGSFRLAGSLRDGAPRAMNSAEIARALPSRAAIALAMATQYPSWRVRVRPCADHWVRTANARLAARDGPV